MSYYQWIITLPKFILVFISIIMGINFTIDPLQQFRISQIYPIYFDSAQQRHLNSGLAKNYNYDSIVLGTSHTEYFSLNEVEKELSFQKAIKFSMGGASAYEEGKLLASVLHSHSPQHILYGLDLLAFSRKKNASFPDYLYEENIINTLQYLLKFDTTIRSFNALKNPYTIKNPRKFELKHMYENYVEDILYAKELMVKHPYGISKNTKIYSFEIFKKTFETNFLHLIKDNNDVHYTIFYPPYSILTYKQFYDAGILDDLLLFKKYIYETIGSLPNVKIHDFHIAKEITHNLDNYKDYSHYHQNVSSLILKDIKNNRYLVTRENHILFLDTLRKQIKNYELNATIKQ